MKILFYLFLFCLCLYAKPRIIVLDAAIIEALYLLDAEDTITAIAQTQNSTIYPHEKTKNLPSVGTYARPSLEKIVSLKPTLVVLNRYSVNLKEDLQRLGIESVHYPSNSLQDVLSNLLSIAQKLNKEKKANEIIQQLQSRLQTIQSQPIGKKGVFFYSSSPLMAFSKDTLAGDVLKLLGITNIAKDSFGDRPILNQEFLLVQNPDFIFYGLGLRETKDLYKTNPLIQKTKAFKNNHIFYINASLLLRGSPLIIDEIERIHRLLSSI